MFFFFCLLSREVREKWLKLLPRVCRSKRSGYAFTDNAQLSTGSENLYMTQYDATKPTEMETKGASPEAGEMGEKGLSSDVVIPNPLAAATASGDDAKVDLALEGTYEEIDNKDTKL